MQPTADEALTRYVLDHYGDLWTPHEVAASRSALAEAKAVANESPAARHLLQKHVSKDPEVLRLLADGVAAFRLRVRDRLLAEHADKIYLNLCPKCGALARTPKACLCPACNHTWYELRQK